jgi:hypothetical protein
VNSSEINERPPPPGTGRPPGRAGALCSPPC